MSYNRHFRVRRILNPSTVRRTATATVAAAVIFGVPYAASTDLVPDSLSVDTAAAWQSSQTASAICTPDMYGFVHVSGSFLNEEPRPTKGKPQDWNDMRVVMQTPFGTDEQIAIAGGLPVDFSVPTELKSSNGDFNVTYMRYWANPNRTGKPDPTSPILVSGVSCMTQAEPEPEPKPKPKPRPKPMATACLVSASLPARTNDKPYVLNVRSGFRGKNFHTGQRVRVTTSVTAINGLAKLGPNRATRVGRTVSSKPNQLVTWKITARNQWPQALHKNVYFRVRVNTYGYKSGKIVRSCTIVVKTYDPQQASKVNAGRRNF